MTSYRDEYTRKNNKHRQGIKIGMLIIMCLSWLTVIGSIEYAGAVDTVTSVRYTTQPASDAYNYGVWSNYVGGTRVTGMESYANQKVEVTREAMASNGKWLEFKVNGKIIGWVGEKGVEPTKTEVLYPATTKEDAYNYGVWSDYIGGTRVTGLADFEGKQLEVTKEATVSGSIWVEFKVNGRVIGWVSKSGVNEGDSIVKSMNLKGEKLANEDSIQLTWNALDKKEPYTYQVYSKKPGMTEFQTISVTDLNKKVKVLNVYPITGGNITYTTHDGTVRTLPKAASAERWMEEPNATNAKGFGMGLIDVDPVDIDTFNTNPQGVMKNTDGSWKYDVVFFGSYDSNGSKDLSVASSDMMIEFIKSGRGALLGHDVIASGWSMPTKITDVNFGRLMPYMNIEKVPDEYDSVDPVNIPLKYQVWGSDHVELTSSGLLNSYPWDIGDLGTELTIPYTHTGWLIHKGERWLKFKDIKNISANVIPRADLYMANENPEMNAYLSTWSNTAMIQTGHSNGEATLDEQKILANTLFYLSQLTTDTRLTDRSAMDVYAPEFDSEEVKVTKDSTNVTIDFPSAKEVASVFEYYVEATGQNTGAKEKSETIQVTNESGFAGYYIHRDSNPNGVTDKVLETTESSITISRNKDSLRYLHVNAVDKKGNESETLHIMLDESKPSINVTKSTENWVNKDIKLNLTISDTGSGLNTLTLTDGKVVSYNGDKQVTETFTVTKNGVYKFIVTDKEGNESTKEITIDKIDKIAPTVTTENVSHSWTSNSVTFKVSAYDEHSGIADIVPEIPDGGYLTTQGDKHVYTYTAFESGEYDFVITDKAGNETKQKVTVNNIDKDSPELGVELSTTEWTNENVQLTATGKDIGSGVKNIRMATDVASKNLVSMSDIQLWHGKDHQVTGKAFKFKPEDTVGYGGLYIPASLVEADQWYTLSFDITKLSGNIPYLGGHMHISSEGQVYVDGKVGKTLEGTSRHPFNKMEYPNDTKKHHVTIHMLTDEYSIHGDKNVYIQPNRATYGEDYEVVIENVQFEKGKVETPYEPHYLDLLDNVNPLKVNASENGEYKFTATDNVGNETTKSVNITNIDKEAPTTEISGNPTTYVDDATIEITAMDALSGVKSITLPDGKVVTSTKTTFKVNANGKYEYIVTDNTGNSEKHTIEVTKIKIPYMFYLYDAEGKPLAGAGFDLLRNGVKYSEAISDVNGLVDFGKVPADGVYTIKQTKAPDGYVIDPNEKDVEVGDTTEPEEFINYPRGVILPATGTISEIGLTLSVLTLVGTIGIVGWKKSIK